ncbi:hypothetical protein FHY35_004062 [Xanthomonas arboricola]|uniref:hypothetical protein n=1 Tax=Xanthomonas arboricola TaxID=56448 RepID=UPI001D1EB433|nr:hypothetical protein [Xanthomonas arboricola]NIJ87012.1 hypothetical protein [Xanthomonas arboricola]
MKNVEAMNIAGKDWLTVDEAAHYCGVSNSQFRKHAASYGICPRNFMGKQLYEKNALYAAIAGAPEWHRTTSAAAVQTASYAGLQSPSPAVRSAMEKLSRFKGRKR